MINRRAFNKLAGLTLAGRRLLAASTESDPWKRYFLGAAYYLEWWPRSEWETDFREMQALGINAVCMGEFAWACYEPSPGKFEFAWMDHAIELARFTRLWRGKQRLRRS